MSQQRLVVITGVSRGLGLAMTEAFIERGHAVAGCGRSSAAIDQLRKAWGPPHRFDEVDVSDDHAVGHWAATVTDQFGVPDLLINNAALINTNRPLWAVPPSEFSSVIDTNIKGVFHTIRHFLPAMIERKTGVIVNLSSGWGRSTAPEVAPYCATKWAIEGLTRALADELPHGLAAVPCNPGVIHTEMLQSCFGDGAAAYECPADWAQRAVPFLLQIGPAENGRPLTVPAT